MNTLERKLRLMALAIAGLCSAGCADGIEPVPICMGVGPGATARELTCTATATFCVGGPPDVMGECPDGVEVRTGYEPFPGASMTCTGCVLTTGDREDPALTCQNALCRSCDGRSGSGRCISCTASVVAVGPTGCTLSDLPLWDGYVHGSAGVDAGPPGIDGGPIAPEPRFVVDSYSYGGGTSFSAEPIAHIDIEEELGRPTAVSADELLWVGFESGAIRGYDVTTGEVEITARLLSPDETPTSVNNLQMYRADGRLFGVAALSASIERFEIVGTTLVSRGMFSGPTSADARIHSNVVLRDDGYVVGVSSAPNVLWVIPRIDATGAFTPRSVALASMPLRPRAVAPEAVPDGFVFTGARSLVSGRADTFRTTDLASVGAAAFDGARVMGIGGPDETSTAGFELLVAVNGATAGSIIAYDPVTYVARDSEILDGLISGFAMRAAGAELYAFVTTTASGLGPATLAALIPTAPSGLTPAATHRLSAVDEVIDLAVGVEALFPPPEPHEPIPLERTSAVVHLLIERP